MGDTIYPQLSEYRVPRKNILVLSCIDLRLTDDLLRFLDHDNLTNRYDHFALAGTSLCTITQKMENHSDPQVLDNFNNFEHWRKSLDDHLK
jgi:hypothetical protein